MNRAIRALGWLLTLVILHALTLTGASAQPTISNAEVMAVTINQPVLGGDRECGTYNSQFTFRAAVTTAATQRILGVFVTIDPIDPANPEFGPQTFPMVRDGSQPNGWKLVKTGAEINGFTDTSAVVHRWSIIAQDTGTGGMPVGWSASPKPASELVIFPNQDMEIMPVGPDYLPDKRSIPGQPGNGLRIDPADPTSPNDAGGAHIFTWRVRVRSQNFYGALVGGLPAEFFLRRANYEWRDVRGAFDTLPLYLPNRNSGLILVLIAPDGTKHLCPMEVDPDNPQNIASGFIANGTGNDRVTYPLDPRFGGVRIYRPRGGGPWQAGQGVYYRFRMMPTQYIFNHGGLPGEGPFTAFGGPTLPDSLPAIPIGYGAGADTEAIPSEVFGRPYNNQYSAFAGPDRTSPLPSVVAPPFPLYTDIAGRSGQWKYYYVGTTDLRPTPRNGFPANFFQSDPLFPFDRYGADPDAYLFNYDSDTGLAPGDPSVPYNHPFVTPILSDGGWTDDIPENGWGPPFGVSRASHRSRATTKTRVRFMVRVTQPNQNGTLLVRVFIDGTAHAMQVLPIAGNNIYANGVIYFYDQSFPGGQEGRHWIYYEADDGTHKVIWPRRDSDRNPTWTGTGAANPPIADLQPLGGRMTGPKNVAVDFGTGTVGVNFLDEPLVNHRPELLNPAVTPPTGVSGQAFTYTINFFDADNDEPVDAIVNIDGTDYRMTAADTNRTDNAPGGVKAGRLYKFVMNALPQTPDKQHTYFFKFRDNWNNLAAYRISPIRREFGEWVTSPQGDDNGNPAFVYSGPTFTDNSPSELYEPNFFFGDPAQTPATLYDFAVKYRDANNEAPATIKMYISQDDGATWDQGTSLVKAENSNNYAAGVQYHLPTRIRLPYSADNKNPPAFKYRYKFIANDGHEDTVVLHAGTGANAIQNGSAHTLVGIQPSPTTIFADPNGSRNWVGGGSLHVFKTNGNNKRELNGPGTVNPEYTYSPTDLQSGQIVLAAPAVAGDIISASYFFVDLAGPAINPNHTPVLSEPIPPPPGDPLTNNGTISKLSGNTTDSFTYSIIYKDADNQAPITTNGQANKIDLIVDNDTTRNPPLQLNPATNPPFDYVRGVKFTLDVPGSTLGVGAHSYHFETTDGADIARFPLATAQQLELSGPSIFDKSNLVAPPTANFPNDRDIVPFPKGKSNDSYMFTVVYQSQTGQAPPADILLYVTDNATGQLTTVKMNPIDPIGQNGQGYINGIRYQVGITAPAAPLTVGDHDIAFGFSGLGAATQAKTLTVNAPPTLNIPGNPATPLISATSISRAGDLQFNIVYQDVNGDLPERPAGGANTMKLVITKPDGTLVSTLAPSSPANPPTPAQVKQAVLYSWTVPARNLIDLALPMPQQFKFYIQAQDDVEDSVPPQVPALPGGDFTVVEASQFTLTAPTTGASETDPASFLSPTIGGQSQQYTYRVKYTHPDNVGPVTIQVIIDPGANQIIHDMTREDNNAFSAGTVYKFVTAANELKPGTHTFVFKAADRINTITKFQTGATPFTGPSVNNPPSLTLGTVYLQGTQPVFPNGQNAIVPAVSGNILNKFIFTVTYSDVEGTAPAFVQVKLNDGSPVIALHPANANPDFSGGKAVQYVSDPVSLTPGAKTFHFETKDNLDAVQLPAAAEITGLTIRNIPALSSPNTGTLTPGTGPLSQTFTYQVIYTHADGTAPAATGGVQVFIDGTAHDMTKVGQGAFTAGVLYQFSFRFPSNSGAAHTYRFQAVDSVDPAFIAKLPTDGSNLNGPSLNVPVFLQPSFTPNPGVAGAQMKIDGQLSIVPSSAQPIALKLVRPDGTGIPVNLNTNADGTFSHTFTPDQTGDWKVSLSWAGTPGVYDPITTEFTFKVTGFSLLLQGGVIDMISSPLVPVTPDPGLTFGTAKPKPDGTPLPVTELQLIKWVPSIAPAGNYLRLNVDANFPGITGGQGYWVSPKQTLEINPRGKLADQAQPYSIPLEAGWNMVGSVYLQDINWGAVKVRFQGGVIPLADAGSVLRSIAWTYDASSGGYVLVDPTNGVLKTGRGYWVKALQPCDLILSPPGTRAVTLTRDVVERSTSLQIAARSGRLSDTNTFVPLSGTTASRLALMEKPPYLNDYVSVRLTDISAAELPAETRAAAAGSKVITFQVESSLKNQDVSVLFPNMSTLGRKADVMLVDLASGTKRALGSNAGYSFNTGESSAPRRFALLVNERTANSALIISDVQATGRAAAGLTFSFNISTGATVRAQVVGATGIVRELSQGRAVTRGVNALVWDGKNSRGAAVPAGTYMLKLTATDEKGRQVTASVPVTLTR